MTLSPDTYADPRRYRLWSPEDAGTDGYPAIWHTLKHEVRAHVGHRCVRCGHPYRNGQPGGGEWSRCDERCTHGGPIRHRTANGPIVVNGREDARVGILDATRKGKVDARWRILTVHHLNGVKWDLRWWNLVALCQRCHLQIQGKVQMERIWPWEHSEWFRPYVAAYYASVYLGEELSPAEVAGRLDELLALERAA